MNGTARSRTLATLISHNAVNHGWKKAVELMAVCEPSVSMVPADFVWGVQLSDDVMSSVLE